MGTRAQLIDGYAPTRKRFPRCCPTEQMELGANVYATENKTDRLAEMTALLTGANGNLVNRFPSIVYRPPFAQSARPAARMGAIVL